MKNQNVKDVKGAIFIIAKSTLKAIVLFCKFIAASYRLLDEKTNHNAKTSIVLVVIIILLFLTTPAQGQRNILSQNYVFGEKGIQTPPIPNKLLIGQNRGLYTRVINEYLKGTPMEGLGEIAIETAYDYDLPRYLIIAMAKHESDLNRLGYAIGKKNPWGLGVHLGWDWKTWNEAFDKMGFTLREYYFNEGRTAPETIEDKWAPGIENSYGYEWSAGVNKAGLQLLEIENKFN